LFTAIVFCVKVEGFYLFKLILLAYMTASIYCYFGISQTKTIMFFQSLFISSILAFASILVLMNIAIAHGISMITLTTLLMTLLQQAEFGLSLNKFMHKWEDSAEEIHDNSYGFFTYERVLKKTDAEYSTIHDGTVRIFTMLVCAAATYGMISLIKNGGAIVVV
jgi:hypothetical protein